jgi:hypothetical protein
VSIAILVVVHDGLVLAADSASTVITSGPGGIPGVANVYNNANKIVNLIKGEPLGCIVFGAGSIGSASISTLLKDLRSKIGGDDSKTRAALVKELKDALPDKDWVQAMSFDKKYSVAQVATLLAAFLESECQKVGAAAKTTEMGAIVGGYSKGSALGEAWFVELKEGSANAPQCIRKAGDVGITWGGSGEVINRIVCGFSPSIFAVLAEAGIGINGQAVTAQDLLAQLNPLLLTKLNAQLVSAPMPIQDAIDLGEFLVYVAEMFSRFLPGAQVVGGPIEVAAVTKHEGFKWINRKHYYNRTLNVGALENVHD